MCRVNRENCGIGSIRSNILGEVLSRILGEKGYLKWLWVIHTESGTLG